MCAEAIGNKIEDLKKGRTEVLESGHTLILGWSDKMLNMIDQLCLANESAGGKAIVILAERDKQDMEYDIHKQIHNLRGSRVLCRSEHGPYDSPRHSCGPLHFNMNTPLPAANESFVSQRRTSKTWYDSYEHIPNLHASRVLCRG